MYMYFAYLITRSPPNTTKYHYKPLGSGCDADSSGSDLFATLGKDSTYSIYVDTHTHVVTNGTTPRF